MSAPDIGGWVAPDIGGANPFVVIVMVLALALMLVLICDPRIGTRR